MSKPKNEVKQTPAEVAAMMRKELNTHMGKEVAKTHTAADKLLQISNWIPMGPWHTKATGGDLPCGHFTVLLGLSNSGKTSCMMEAAVNTQRAGGIVYLVDSERKFSFDRFELMGGVTEDLIVISATSLEDAWNAITGLLRTVLVFREEKDPENKVPILVLWDSIAAAISSKLMEQEAEKDSIAVEAKRNNSELRKVKILLEKTNVAMISVAHHYWTIPVKYGEISKLVIKGGNEIEWLATNILLFEKGAKITREVKGEKQRIGTSARVEAYKSHAASFTTKTEIHVVDRGILSTDEELKAYRESIK
jgi:RecA/RadA recombinase